QLPRLHRLGKRASIGKGGKRVNPLQPSQAAWARRGTPPEGTTTMPRFVILEHDHPQLHWDLMLETGDVLRTWRLGAPPAEGEFSAEPSFDHRLLYLDYEGPISGDRGRVVRRDRGTYDLLTEGSGVLDVRLGGEKWRGTLQLRQGPE